MGLPEILLLEARDSTARASLMERVARELELEARPLTDLFEPARRQFTPDVWRGAAASAAQHALAAKAVSVAAIGNDLLGTAARLREQAVGQREDAAALRRQADHVRRQQHASTP